MPSTTSTSRLYHYHFTFRVGGWKRGYDCHLEVKAPNKKSAAVKFRKMIRAMPDVEECPKFHYEEVRKGLPVLASEGHDRKGFCKRKRPVALAFGTRESHPDFIKPKKRRHRKEKAETTPSKPKRVRKFREPKEGEVLSKRQKMRRAKAYVEMIAAQRASA